MISWSYYTNDRVGQHHRLALREALVPASEPCWSWPQIHPETPIGQRPMFDCLFSMQLVQLLCLAGSVHSPEASFFICQPHISQHITDRWQTAGQPSCCAHFGKRHIRLFLEQYFEPLAMRLKYLWLSSRPMMLGRQVAYPSSLLQQLLHHAQRDSEPLGHLQPGPARLIVTLQYPFPYFHTYCLHAAILTTRRHEWLHY